ncbi:MAG TPA: hypothetical protein VN826_04490, partial [Candidatus Eisenbacteria bacterium]|nr:hypothetical protein [Candidatus Eisenbacteria bacterium]
KQKHTTVMLSGSEASQFFYSPLAMRDSSAEFILSKIEGPRNDTCAVIRVFAKAQLQLRKDPSWSEP